MRSIFVVAVVTGAVSAENLLNFVQKDFADAETAADCKEFADKLSSSTKVMIDCSNTTDGKCADETDKLTITNYDTKLRDTTWVCAKNCDHAKSMSEVGKAIIAGDSCSKEANKDFQMCELARRLEGTGNALLKTDDCKVTDSDKEGSDSSDSKSDSASALTMTAAIASAALLI